MLTDVTAAALLALVALPPVLADAAAAAGLAPAALPPVLADATAATVLAAVALPPVLAEAAASAVFALAALSPVLALLVYHSHVVEQVRRRDARVFNIQQAVETVPTRRESRAVAKHHAHTLHTYNGDGSSSSRYAAPSKAHSAQMLHVHSSSSRSSSSKRMTAVQRGMADVAAAAAHRRHFAAAQPPPRVSMRANSPLRAVSNSTYTLSTATPHDYASDTFWSEPIPDAPPYRRLVERLLAPLGRMLHRA